jgi:hypothetical protein
MDHTGIHAFIYTAMLLFGLAVLLAGGYMLWLLCRKDGD